MSAPRTTASRRRRIARIVSWIAVITSVTVLGVTVAGFGLVTYFNRKIDRQPVFDRIPEASRPDPSPGKALNFLLVGSDSREGATEEELREFGTEDDGGGKRTDTIILVHLSAKRDKALLVSLPRDSRVEIPGYGTSRINIAFAKEPSNGASLLIQTVEQLTNVRIDHYIEVNFAGFLRVVNALDGVDVCLTQPLRDAKAAIDLPAGRHRLRGRQALGFVRTRKFPNSDFGRIRQQQAFMAAMLRRATSLGILANPNRLLRFVDAVASSLTVDSGLGLADMKHLADRLRSLDPGRVTFVTMPMAGSVYVGGRYAGERIDEDGSRALWDAIRTDGPVPGASPAPSSPPSDLVVAPSRIRVRVLNGSGVRGAAARAAADLAALGFVIRGTGNADATSYAGTVVRHGPEKADSARTVAAAIPGSSVQLDHSLGRTLEVVVGSSYAGTRPVTVGAPSPRPAPTASLPSTTAADEPEGC